MFFGFSIGELLGIMLLGYFLITAVVFVLNCLCCLAARGFHSLLARLAAYLAGRQAQAAQPDIYYIGIGGTMNTSEEQPDPGAGVPGGGSGGPIEP